MVIGERVLIGDNISLLHSVTIIAPKVEDLIVIEDNVLISVGASIIGNINNKIKTGISISYDEYDEYVNNLGFNDFDISRIEKSVGAYFEYNYDNLDKINLSAGIRFDNHNKIGNFISPRFHMNYMVLPKSTIKFSFGKATRLANIFSENQKLFYSSREIIFTENSLPSDFSSMKADQAWNYGVSIINSFKLFKIQLFTI